MRKQGNSREKQRVTRSSVKSSKESFGRSGLVKDQLFDELPDEHSRAEIICSDKESDVPSGQLKTSSSSVLIADCPRVPPNIRLKHKDGIKRRNAQTSSMQTETESTQSKRLFFRRDIEDYYPTSIKSDQIRRLDTILTMKPENTQLQEMEASLQRALQLSPQSVLNTITLTEKSDGEVVSILVRRPIVSGLLYFKIAALEQNSQGQHSPKERGVQDEEILLELTRSEYLNNEDATEMEKRNIFRTHFLPAIRNSKTFFDESTDQTDEVSQQLLFLDNFLKFKHRENTLNIEALKAKVIEEGPAPTYPEIREIENQFVVIALRKNIARGFKDRQVDPLNHFKLKACLEQHRPYEPNKNLSDLAEFLAKKKIRKNKKTKFPLATSCLGCFSDFCEDRNPIQSCYECGVRSHRLCKLLQNSKCSVCEGKRSKKIRIKECVLCPNRGLLFRRCQEFNMHVFCLLVFGHYSVRDLEPVIEVGDVRVDRHPQVCMCCKESMGRLVKCTCCQQYAHPSCCYLAGFLMSIDDRNMPSFHCTYYSTQQLVYNKFTRLYRANLHKYAYRFTSFQEFIAKSKKKSSDMEQEVYEKEMTEERHIELLEESEPPLKSHLI